MMLQSRRELTKKNASKFFFFDKDMNFLKCCIFDGPKNAKTDVPSSTKSCNAPVFKVAEVKRMMEPIFGESVFGHQTITVGITCVGSTSVSITWTPDAKPITPYLNKVKIHLPHLAIHFPPQSFPSSSPFWIPSVHVAMKS